MEPRIATLLGDSNVERATLDALPLLPPPHLLEPNAISDDARASAVPRHPGLIGKDIYQPSTNQSQQLPPAKRQKSSVPIAGVLNKETPTPSTAQPVPAASAAALPPFSGRLSDLLLDPSQQHSNKRRRVEEQAPPALTGSENTLLKLPKPHQLPKKTAKRPRIPPLLQGLHQPPPLPEGRLFPPITGEGGGFGRNIGEIVGLRSPAGLEKNKEKDAGDAPSSSSNNDVVEDVRDGVKGKETDKPASATSDKENQASVEKCPAPKRVARSKETRKRNKWSEQETKDLLIGVSRFGIGNWKKILQCPDFQFNQRTAVDLKDRFRTCCPGDSLKQKKSKSQTTSQDADSQSQLTTSTSSTASNSQEIATQDSHPPDSTTESAPTKSRVEKHTRGSVNLAEMGIHVPFVKHKRRERREFTEKDDENLLKGFEKYGSSWHSMRDDGDLGFSERHPTDLRDRFRIRYPEMFAKAGYKLKPKDELMLKEKAKGKQKEAMSSQESSNSTMSEKTPEARKIQKAISTADTHSSSLTTSASANPKLRPLALREPLLNSFPSPLEDFADLASEEDGDGSRSPIILNRNIFQWADANPSQAGTGSAASLPTITTLTGEMPLNFVSGTEDIHINPMVTVNFPMALLTSNVLSAIPSYPSSNPSLPSRSSHGYSQLNGVAASVSSAAPGNNSSSTLKQSINPLLRTPNLPTIVFPHVPASSARGTVHNLPPPADLLSGVDIDGRIEPQANGLALDDSIGFALPSSTGGYGSTSTLAPMVSTATGRGILSLERGLLEEPIMERRGLSGL